MTTQLPEQPDDRLARLLATTSADAAPPDRAALAAIRERSAAEFSVAGQPIELSPTRKWTMLAIRAAVVLAATAAVGLFALLPQWENFVGSHDPIHQSIARLQKNRTFRGQLVQHGETAEVLGSKDRLRIDSGSGRYTIVAGPQLWRVDEADNRATQEESSLLRSGGTTFGFNPFPLLGIDADSVATISPGDPQAAREKGEHFVSFGTAEAAGELVDWEARIDGKTLLPDTIRTFPRGERKMPLGEFRLVAVDEPVAADKLQVPATLTEDGRIGKIVDSQGLVSLRPLTSTRWTPVCGHTILRPGDWLRTDFQGANAVTVQLAPETKLILGPGALVQLEKPDRITLHSGIAEITPSPKTDRFSGIVKLTGPAGTTLDVGSLLLLRADAKGIAKLAKDPPWLAGYKGNAVQESLGSLVAEIDGRRVPLTVGYHKVSVEIRDQIARTTIEESFVNHTNSQLEGQFHFPLPADASISGFGMWIGDKLVEADVVEKQRAREIYETILREKRDPGLLEWTGGNLFKARVFPIFAKSEKRIKIVYTQVLPRKGDSYRYSYALQSDLLRQNPLRQLDLDVTVSSTLPLAGVQSPTHTTRNQISPHAARVEFSAQKYTPDRDFEVVVQVAGDSPDVVFVPHQRGDDGYFLLQLQPPAGAGAWQRDVLPDTGPLHLLILADTSASMDASSRRTQAEVLAALLASLSPQDSFQLAVCDVDCLWASEKAQPADEKNITAAREFLARRRSLGWTNLDRAFETVLKQARPGTQVVYLGDGIVTSGDMDGPAFTQRLTRLAGGKGATLHAVAVSSSYDASVLRGISSIGGGSLRNVSGETGPQQTARDLLAEITRPALRNIQLEFKGLRTARVYPRVLPNVPAGTQQIILGRYLPATNEQRGEVIVTGTLDGKLVTYRAAIDLSRLPTPDPRLPTPSSDDASFTPRLWARMHLDELLAQGTSQAIQDEIINLSEEFHLITPYTSLLVLESDADRERFKVKKRFQMRDCERFFAQGRDDAQYQLVQQQMQRAGLWRAGLRQSVLSQLADWGRNVEQIEGVRGTAVAADYDELIDLITDSISPQSWSEVSGDGSVRNFSSNLSLVVSQTQLFSGSGEAFGMVSAYGGRAGGPGIHRPQSRLGRLEEFDEQEALYLAEPASADEGFLSKSQLTGKLPNLLAANEQDDLRSLEFGRPMSGEFDAMKRLADFDEDGIYAGDKFQQANLEGQLAQDGERGEWAARTSTHGKRGLLAYDPYGREDRRSNLGLISAATAYYDQREQFASEAAHGFDLLPDRFPPLPGSERKAKERKSLWPAEAQALSRSIQTAVELTKLTGGLVIEEQTEFAQRPEVSQSHARRTLLTSAGAWLVRDDGDRAAPRLNWCDGAERGVLALAYELSLVRKSVPEDLPKRFDSHLWWQGDFQWSFQDDSVELKPQEGDRVLVALRDLIHTHKETLLLVDRTKHVVLSIEFREFGKPHGTVRASDFAQVAGVWLPQRIESANKEGRVEQVTTRKYQVVPQDKFTALLKEQLAAGKDALTLRGPVAKLQEAKDRVTAGKGSLEDRLVVLQDLANHQRWPEALEELVRCEKLIGGKFFAGWLRLNLLAHGRRHEELRKLLLVQAAKLASQPHAGEYPLAEELWQLARRWLAADETLAVLDALRPIYARPPAHEQGLRQWSSNRIVTLAETGRTSDLLAERRRHVAAYPEDANEIRNLASLLGNEGEFDAAYAVLKAALTRPNANWSAGQRDEFYEAWANLLHEQGRYADLAAMLADWLKLNPESYGPYERYLAALVYTDREAEADKLLGEWLAAGIVEPPVPPAIEARALAAIRTVTRSNSYLSSQDADARFFAPLMKLLLAYADREDGSRIVSNLHNDWQIRNTDPFVATMRELIGRLKAGAATLSPGRLEQLIQWVTGYAPQTPPDDWKSIAAAIQKRWEAATHPIVRQSLAESLLRVISQIGQNEKLAFLRLQLAKSDDDHRARHAHQLFNALLEATWSLEIEAESLALIEKLGDADDADAKLRDQIVALYRWTDRMDEGQYESLVAKIDRPDKLKRTELAEKQTALRKQARTEVSDRLVGGASRLSKSSAGLAKWMRLESLYLDAKLQRNLPKVVESCWELLGPPPAAPAKKPAEDTEQLPPSVTEQLDLALRARVLAMLLGLATRKDAPAAEIARLTKYLDQTLAADPDGKSPGIDAKLAKYLLLVALDQPKELAEQLAAWSKGTDRPALWKRSLAYLKAETGDLEGAVALASTLSADDGLVATDYRALAGWQQALNRREQHDAALVASYSQMDEYQLRRFVQAHLQPWQQTSGPTPGSIDPQVLLVLRALFQKASSPGDHVYVVREFYEASREFRLLAALADAVIGHSAGGIYPFLRECRSVFEEIDREATADELVQHIATVRKEAKTPVDRRALDILEMLVESRAAALQNQPAPHVAAAIAALKRAEKEEWSAGEPRLMAQMLADLGHLSQQPLSDERARVIGVLHAAAKGEASDRLEISRCLAQALSADNRRQPAIDALEAALAEHLQSTAGKRTDEALASVNLLATLYGDEGQFIRAEQAVRSELPRAANPKVASSLTAALWNVQIRAIENGGSTSLGSGVALYRAAHDQLVKEALATPDHAHRRQLVDLVCRLFREGHRKYFALVATDAVAFGQETLPELLKRQVDNYQNLVQSVFYTIRDIAGQRAGLAFLITRMEREPTWLARRGDSGWRHFAWDMGNCRDHETVRGKLGDLEPRLLKIVLAELRRELKTHNRHQGVFYHDGYTHFWREKTDDFARVAEEALKEQRDSRAGIDYISEYFYSGLRRYDRGIAILLDAHQRKLRSESSEVRLVNWLHEQSRYGESIALLEPLVESNPDVLGYRIQLMHAYYRTKRPDALQALLTKTDKHFHADNRWNDDVAGRLASSCLENRLFEQAIEYYKEAISRREKALANRGIGDQTLAQWYIDQAYAYAGLKNTAAAVEAASSAIVVWGTAGDGIYRRNAATNWQHGREIHPLDVLREVLQDSPNLDAFVAELDKQVAESKQDRPILRKAIGEVYAEREMHDKAIVQLKLAVELAPNDGAIHAKLVESYDAAGNQRAAAEQLYASVELARRDIDLWVKLSERLEKLEQPAEAERARTSLVEMLPNETEGHAKLAEIRQSQVRWDDAIGEWRHVARLRKLEPAGLLNLATAQLHQKDRAAADESLKDLEKTNWPARFEAELREKLPKLRDQWRKLPN